MYRLFTRKLSISLAVTGIIGFIAVFGVITHAINDAAVLGQLWKPGLSFWQDTVTVEPGQDFKIMYFAGNNSTTGSFSNTTLTSDLPAFTSYVTSSSFIITGTGVSSGVWQALTDSGSSPFLGAGVNVTDDAVLTQSEFGNYKYSVKVNDFIPTGTTQLTWAGPVLHFTNVNGAQNVGNSHSTSISVINAPAIQSLTITPSGPYKLGSVINVSAVGTAGKSAYVKIGNNINIVLTGAGTSYTGSYTIQAGDDLTNITPRLYLANSNNTGVYLDAANSVTIDAIAPPSPTAFTGLLNGDQTITLSWTAPGTVSDVAQYYIYSATGAASIDFTAAPLATVAVGTNQYITAVLVNDVLYKYAIRAVDSTGNNDGSTAVITKSTDIVAPDAPASLVQPTSLNSQVLKYNAGTPLQFVWASSLAADLARYRLEIDDNSDFSSIITSQEPTVANFSLTTAVVSLTDGVYYWRVYAIDDAELLSATAPSGTFEIDNAVPGNITASQPINAGFIGGNFTMSGTAADAGTHLTATNGLAKVEVFLTNTTTGQHWSGTAWGATLTYITVNTANNFSAWTYPFTATIANTNLYTTGARVTDKAGNQLDTAVINLTGDTNLPALSAITLTNSTLGGTTIFKNGHSVVLTATITDNLGQSGMATTSIQADLSAITGNAGDNAMAPASYNTGNGLATWAAVTANAGSDGVKSVTITAADLAANNGASNGTITADNTVPTIQTTTSTSPSASGLTWGGGSVQNITWNSADITDTNLAATPVTLEYTTDGSAYTLIAANEANDGTYAWTLPSINSATVKVRLTAADNAGSTVSDVSDNNFTIDSVAPSTASVVLTNSTLSIPTFAKNGDTVVLTATITDNLLQAGLTAANVTANFMGITNNAGDSAVAPTSYNPANGLATWLFKTVAGTTNGNLSLSITAADSAGNSATYTNTAVIVADNTAPAITTATLTVPSAASITYAGGAVQNITWNQAQITDTNLAATPITLEYSTNGSTYTLIAANEANDGTYAWTLPSINFQTVTVRITASDQVALTSTDVSDNNFTIDSTTPTVTAAALTAPNGAEAWKQGTVQNITWNNAAVTDNFGLTATPVTLEYTTDGSAWNPIASNEANDGTYAWTTPVINFTTVKVRLTATDLAGLTGNDQSDANFSVGLPPVIVQVRAMNNTLIEVEWDKNLSAAGAFANYTATGLVPTAAAVSGGNAKIVNLTVNALNNTGFMAADLAVALNTVTDTSNFQNEATSTVAIIDKQAPQFTLATSYPNTDQLVVDNTLAMRLAVSEAPGGATVFKLDTVTQATGYNATDKVITFTPGSALAAGKHTISLDLVDVAGNSVPNQTWDFWVDNFTTSMVTAPVAFLFNGNVFDDGSGAEQQSITVSTFGAGYKVYAFFTPTVSDGAGNLMNDMDIKLAADPWSNKIDLNGATMVQLASVTKSVTPSLTAVNTTYTYDLRANIPGITQAAGVYNGTMQFIVVPEY